MRLPHARVVFVSAICLAAVSPLAAQRGVRAPVPTPRPVWTVTASDNPAAALRALGATGWTSIAPQRAGMWFQVELPASTTIAEIRFDSATFGKTRTLGLGAASVAGAKGGPGGKTSDVQPEAPRADGAPAGDGAPSPVSPDAPGARIFPGAPPPVTRFPIATRAGAPRPSGAAEPLEPGGPAPLGAPGTGVLIGFPLGYRVQISLDGVQWIGPVAEGKGEGAQTTIPLKPVLARFIRITETDNVPNAPPWSIMNLKVVETRR